MSVELVTGYYGVDSGGKPKRHVSSAEDGARQAGTVGTGMYVLSTGSKLSASMENANTLVVADGDVVMNGRHVSLPDATSFTIPTGVQGQKVSNIAVLRYEKAADSVESVTPLVLTGEPSTGEPTDPEYNSGSILDGDSPVDMPLYRVVTDGINAGEPEAMFESIPSLSSLRDSTCRAGTLLLGGGWKAADDTVPQWRMLGDVVIVTGHVQSTYGVNPAAEDPVFNLPYPSAEYSYQSASAGDIYTAWLLSHTGETEVRLFRSDKKNWPSGSKIMLNGMVFRVSPGDGVWQIVGGGGSSGGIDVDDELVDGSKNPVAGGAVKSAIDELRKAVEDIEVGGGGSSISIGDGEPTGAASTGDVYIDAQTGDMWQYE